MKSSIYKKILTTAGAITAGLGILAGINAIVFRRATSDHLLEHEPGNLFHWRYGDVFYTVRGTGTPVLLIHGIYPGAGEHMMRTLSENLAACHRVYTLDLPGFGRSDKPMITFTAYFYVQLLNDFIEQVVKSPVDVIADSLSCTFCSLACQMQPNFYRKLLYVNPCNTVEGAPSPGFLSRLSRLLLETHIVGTFIYNLLTSRPILRRQYQNRGIDLTPTMLTEIWESAHCKGSSAKYAYFSYLTHYMDADIIRPLAKIDHDLYVILSGDLLHFKQQKQRLEDINSSIEVELMSPSAGLPWLEAPDEFLSICHFYFS